MTVWLYCITFSLPVAVSWSQLCDPPLPSPCLCLISQIKKSNPGKLKTKLDSAPHNKTKLTTNTLNKKHPPDYHCIELVFPFITENYYAPSDALYPVLEDQMEELFLMVQMGVRFSAQCSQSSPLVCPWVCLVVWIVLEMVSSPATVVAPRSLLGADTSQTSLCLTSVDGSSLPSPHHCFPQPHQSNDTNHHRARELLPSE